MIISSGKTIYLSRHGQSQYNITKQLGGDSGLSNKGIEYSLKLHEYFQSIKKENIPVCTSTLKRTLQTGKHFINKTSNSNFNEINAGIFEHYTYDRIKDENIDEFNKRSVDKYEYRYPNGESYKDLEERVISEFKKLLELNDEFLLIAHNAVIRVILGYIHNIEKDKIPHFDVPLHNLIKIVSNSNNLDNSSISLLSNA